MYGSLLDLARSVNDAVAAIVTRRWPSVLVQPLTSVRPLTGRRIVLRGGDSTDSAIGPDIPLRSVGESVVGVAARRNVLRRAQGSQACINLGTRHPGEISDARCLPVSARTRQELHKVPSQDNPK